MSFSVNEIEALLTKAARGAGAPASQSATFGQAGALHLARGGDVAALNDALRMLPGGVILSYPVQIRVLLVNGGGALRCHPQDLLRSYAAALPYFVAEAETQVHVHMGQFDKFPRPPRIDVGASAVQQWRDLAARTYVPETEQSRVGGAGAGLTDND